MCIHYATFIYALEIANHIPSGVDCWTDTLSASLCAFNLERWAKERTPIDTRTHRVHRNVSEWYACEYGWLWFNNGDALTSVRLMALNYIVVELYIWLVIDLLYWKFATDYELGFMKTFYSRWIIVDLDVNLQENFQKPSKWIKIKVKTINR